MSIKPLLHRVRTAEIHWLCGVCGKTAICQSNENKTQALLHLMTVEPAPAQHTRSQAGPTPCQTSGLSTGSSHTAVQLHIFCDEVMQIWMFSVWFIGCYFQTCLIRESPSTNLNRRRRHLRRNWYVWGCRRFRF